MPDILHRICERTREDVLKRQAMVPLHVLEHQARTFGSVRDFCGALRRAVAAEGKAFIAEVKKASPSAGVLFAHYDPATIARSYVEGGAAALSVLTDAPFFHGSHADLQAVRGAVPLPVLCKDFMLMPYQVIEARACGADCILLILAALSDDEAQELCSIAHGFGMAVLAEVHTAEEMQRALKLPKNVLLGINHRDLRTLKTNLAVSDVLARLVPEGRTLVGESGIKTSEDIRVLQDNNIQVYLVGESLLRQPDPGSALRHLRGIS